MQGEISLRLMPTDYILKFGETYPHEAWLPGICVNWKSTAAILIQSSPLFIHNLSKRPLCRGLSNVAVPRGCHVMTKRLDAANCGSRWSVCSYNLHCASEIKLSVHNDTESEHCTSSYTAA